jgi:hypothetical protein
MDWRHAKLGGNVLPGWVPLVDELHAEVLDLDPNVVVDQVKEKFGGLRYYFSTGVSSEIEQQITLLVDAAEAQSFEICEVCGAPGELRRDRGWLKTLCDEHARDPRPAWQMVPEETQE